MSVAEKLRPTTAARRWVGLGAAALGWLVLYQANLPFWNWVVFDIAGLDQASRLGSGVHFFFYDSVKIGLLLVGIIFAVTVLRSFMSVERTRAMLGGKREGVGNVMAAGLGVITPFCSCSAVPAFIG
ncbi:MAG: permease, partial [Actinomycetota bacterium]